MTERVKEILLKQMELLQEECMEGGSGHERPQAMAAMSQAIAGLADVYARLEALNQTPSPL